MIDSNQINIFDASFCAEKPTSEMTYSDAESVIRDALSSRDGSTKNIEFSYNKGNMAVSFFSFGGTDRSLWVTLGKKRHKLSVKYAYYFAIDSLMDMRHSVPRSKDGRGTIYFHSVEELSSHKQLILDIYDYREREARGALFDCCHRYSECSDARSCTHPDREIAMCCSYRRKLKEGIIFYGENRNIE